MTDLFISYAHEDEARVRPLVSALEQQGWSVFWDHRIPTGQTWRSYICQHLNEARCVIVAWSRHSVESKWVTDEADEGQKRNRLIPIFLDAVEPPIGLRGVQAADLTEWQPAQPSPRFDQLVQDIRTVLGSASVPQTETTPTKLRETSRQPSGPTRSPKYVIVAVLALIGAGIVSALAVIVGVPDNLASRDERTSSSSKEGLPSNDTQETKLYRGAVRRAGTWEGVDEIEPAQAAHLGRSFRFSFGAAHRPIRIQVQDGRGNCAAKGFDSVTEQALTGECSSARACTVKLSYGEDGSVASEALFDQFDHLMEKMSYASAIVGQFTDAVFPCDRGRSGIRLIQFERIKSGTLQGLDKSITFLDKDRRPKPNDLGSYGRRLEYDQGQHFTKVTTLGPRGENWDPGTGYASQQLTYNERGLEVSRTYLTPDDHFGTDRKGIAQLRRSYDEWGNVVQESYIGLDGKPIFNADGYATVRYKFDEHGNQAEESYYGMADEVTESKNGYAVRRASYDEGGNKLEERYFSVDGKPKLSHDFYAVARFAYDANGNNVEIAYFGVDDKPVISKDGYHVVQRSFDDRGNSIWENYLGVNREPGTDSFGAFKIRSWFNEQNKLEGQDNYDSDGNLTLTTGKFAAWRSKFDPRGNETEWMALGIHQEPVLDINGIANYRRSYDDLGRLTEEAYFGTDGQPISGSEGYAKTTQKYDEHRNIIEQLYFGTDGAPVLDNDGEAGWRATFDERGNPLEMTFFNTEGKTALNNSGIAGWRADYDKRGNALKFVIIDANGKPMIAPNGSAGLLLHYDDKDNLIEKLYVGPSGEILR